MIRKRLVHLLAHAKKYVFYQVAWQWAALICQIVMIWCAACLLEQALNGQVTAAMAARYPGILAAALILRFVCDRGAVRASYRASVDVKRILRDRIYQKLLKLGASYREKVFSLCLWDQFQDGGIPSVLSGGDGAGRFV